MKYLKCLNYRKKKFPPNSYFNFWKEKEFSPKVVDQIDQIMAKRCHFDRKNDRRSFYNHSQKI